MAEDLRTAWALLSRYGRPATLASIAIGSGGLILAAIALFLSLEPIR